MHHAQAYELGKLAAKLIRRSVAIRLEQPNARDDWRDAVHERKPTNVCSPWRKGRKVKRK